MTLEDGTLPVPAVSVYWAFPLGLWTATMGSTNRKTKEKTMSKWVPLLVRIEDYSELASQVAAREARRPDEAAQTPEASVILAERPRAATKAEELLARLKPWRLDDLRQIIDTAPTYKTMARWARAMNVACDHREEFLSTAQIASESGMTINEWRDAPRKLPQHLTAHFPANIEWPLAAVGGRELGRDDQVYWGITAEQAQRWAQARAQTIDSGIPPMTSDRN